MQASENTSKPRLGRVQLDTLIKYRGNFLFATISPCCKGCFMKAWCWTVGYRMVWQSTILGFNTMLCGYLFGEDVNVFDLKSILLCLSMFFSISTICMLVSILATATLFIANIRSWSLRKFRNPQLSSGSLSELSRSWRILLPGMVNPTKTYWNWLWAIKSA